MYIRKLILLLLFLFICDALFAATFTVTSNADSGAGTLRQALLDAAANGTASIDYINFNLPGNTQADITITLLSQLPDVTANVVIDGTTQPGPFLGVSNAKVIITVATPAQDLNAFNISPNVGPTDAVEFYGLYIEGFAPNQTGNGAAIYTTSDCKLVVGAPGKGNVICGNYCGVFTALQNAVIQSNFIGIEPDGKTPAVNQYALSSDDDYDNLLFGGPNAADGNVVLCGNNSGLTLGVGTGPQTPKSVTIENNFFGTDYSGTTAISTFNIPFIQVNDAYTTLNVTSNVFSALEQGIAAFGQATIIVKGNYFGIDKTQTYTLGSGAEAIAENNNISATIGGTTVADQNIFTGYFNPIVAVNSITDVIQNEFYCDNEVKLTDPSGSNYIRITSLLSNSVSGDAPPGATVQLYYYKTQCSTCNPNFCFATVTANAAGVWQYNGTILLNVMASSTVNGNTFGFQPYTMSQSEVTITNYDCHHGGSIVLNEKRQGNFQFVWTDSKGKLVTTSQDAANLQPGTYSLEINEGGTCPVETGQFTVADLTPHVYPSTFQLDCVNTTGHFEPIAGLAPGFTVAKYYWEDSQGNLIWTKSTIDNLAAGNYYLYITDSNGCNSSKALFQVLPPLPPPVIDDSQKNITDANCDYSDGSITGITIANAGSANYGWNKADGTAVSHGQLDLTGVPAGQYYMYVYYNFNCPVIKSPVYTINTQNIITIYASIAVISPSTCSNSNGSISGINVSGATTYQWYDDKNNKVGNTLDLTNVAAGNYYLVASNTVCSQQSQVFTVTNTDAYVPVPEADNVQVCMPGEVLISVKSPHAGYGYRLYDSETSTDILDDNTTGILKAAVSKSRSFYISEYSGDCESVRVEVKVVVGASSVQIPNAFTPNNDGINDVWMIAGLGDYPNAEVQVFNRYGQKVFQSKGYNHPFDGTNSGAALPAGVYYYIINLNSKCNLISGSLTILR